MALEFRFDPLGEYQLPVLTLCNPQRDQLDILGAARDIRFTPVFNSLSELSFTVPCEVNGEKVSYYDKVVKYRLVKGEGIGWFVISSEHDVNDGARHYKKVQCSSYESILNRQKINLADGTYRFWDPVQPEETFLGKIRQTIPSWSIGYVTQSLWEKYRTFEIPEISLYEFLMKDVQETFECIVDFDTEDRKINFYAPDDAVNNTDIMLSLDNLIKNIDVETNDDSIVTALSVIGDDTIGINLVNPMGTNIIYNFSYFKTTEWMSQSLINALTSWETKFASNQTGYSNLLASLKLHNAGLVEKRSKLMELSSELNALYIKKDEYINQGNPGLSGILQQIAQKEEEQKTLKNEITSLEGTVLDIGNQLFNINLSLQFEHNFTPTQLEELNNFIFTDTYQNSNFSITESMTPVQEQELAQDLYTQGLHALQRVSKPIYTIKVSLVNFLFLPQYKPFIQQLQLGATINVQIREDLWFEPVLLKMDIDYANPDKFSVTLSNRFRLNDAQWSLDELLNSNSKIKNKVAVKGVSWSQGVRVAGAAIELVNDSVGSGSTSANDEIKYLGNKILYTDNHWATTKTMFGDLTSPNGGTVRGINASSVVGTLLYAAMNSGYVGGWRVTEEGLFDDYGNYLKKDGTGKLGELSFSLSDSTFNGGIYASKLKDKLTKNNIDSAFGASGTLVVDNGKTYTFTNGVLTSIV